jgi:hypothetical protein
LRALDARRGAFTGFAHQLEIQFLDLPETQPTRCPSHRIQAIQLLSGYDRGRAISVAEALVDDPDPDVAAQAAELLQSLSA